MILIDISGKDLLMDLANECTSNGSKVKYFIADVSNREIMNKIVVDHLQAVKRVDFLFAFAGVSPNTEVGEVYESKEFLIQHNFYSVVNSVELFDLGLNPQEGKPKLNNLVAISSISSLISTHNSGFYSASKAALSAYLKSLRLKYRESDFSVYEIVCGFVDTRVNENLKHASFLQISSSIAAKKILASVSKEKRYTKSIPYFRNLPWYVLRLLPPGLRDLMLDYAHKLIYKK
jgi:short-subunit dehydrogenase